MKDFFLGFLTATLLWGGAAAYVAQNPDLLATDAPIAVVEEPPMVEDAGVAEDTRARRRSKRRRNRRRRRATRRVSTPQGEATTGDDLGEQEMRSLDFEGSAGEAQLSNTQIEAGFDAGIGRIRRCLVLMAGEETVRGRLVFGLRIGANGRVNRVRLSGPAAATTGDAGNCLRQAARALRFDAFDGPEMVVRYPLTLE